MLAFTDIEKLAEINREIAYRIRLYPGLVAKGSLSQKIATRQLDIMRSISDDYLALVRSKEMNR